MPWFRLDDSFHSHPKVVAAGNEAIGLYVRCGSYAAQHLTDGFVPDEVALLYGSRELADTLVRTKLWRRARGGWRMPDYLDYNPSREQVVDKQKARAEAGRKGGLASGRSRQNRDTALDHPLTIEGPVDNSSSSSHSGTDQRKRRSKPEANASPIVEPPSRAHPGSPVVEVVNRANGSSPPRASPETIESIIKEILDVTGRHITADWAHRVAAEILQHAPAPPGNPAAYVRQAIRNDPDPKRRFLPLY